MLGFTIQDAFATKADFDRWLQILGTWNISSGKALLQAANAPAIANNGPGGMMLFDGRLPGHAFRNGFIRGQVGYVTAGPFGLALHCDHNGHGLLGIFGGTPRTLPGATVATNCFIAEWNGRALNVLGYAPGNTAASSPNVWEFRATNGLYELFRENHMMVAVRTSKYPSGWAGVTADLITETWDNTVVRGVTPGRVNPR